MTTPKLVLFSGMLASGKTLIADKLAHMYPKSAHIDVDQIKWCMVNGFVNEEDVLYRNGDLKTCIHQHKLAISASCDVAARYFNDGFNVFMSDPVYLNEYTDLYKQGFGAIKGAKPHFILLSVSQEKMLERMKAQKREMEWELFKMFRNWYKDIKREDWIEFDTSSLSVEQVLVEVQKIINR